jgi:lipopolysaccharide/colanic/teichoic acid biosynthesis glycosyltransferase
MKDHVAEADRPSVAQQVVPRTHQPMRTVEHTVSQRTYLRLRRLADVLLAGAGLLVAAAPMLLVSLGVMVTMGRPVIFTQERVTKDGRIFRLRKFRTMRTADSRSSSSDVDRLVPFGRFLRSASLDELPSLWNILRGDMSLIGPRPLTADYLGRFSAEQFTRHAVPAGLTGLAQVNGRNELGWDERFEMDAEYVRTFGLLLDLRILIATVTAVVLRKGVTDQGGVSMADFPGPRSTTELTLHGPDLDGYWECHDRRGVVVADGTAQIRGGGTVVELSFGAGGRHEAGDAEVLDEAVRLILSRIRAGQPVDWAFVAQNSTLPDVMSSVVRRAGFVRPGESVRYPTRLALPQWCLQGDDSLVAFIGLPGF